MNFMATAKKAAKKVVKTVRKAIEPVVKGSPEWLAMKAKAKALLDSKNAK